jgi:hypothetical protein
MVRPIAMRVSRPGLAVTSAPGGGVPIPGGVGDGEHPSLPGDDEMPGDRDLGPSLCGRERGEGDAGVCQDPVIDVGVDPVDERCPLDLDPHEFLDRVEARSAEPGGPRNYVETGFLDHRAHAVEIAENPVGPEQAHRLGAGMSSRDVDQESICRLSVQRRPHQVGHGCLLAGDSGHLPEGLGRVGEEHQSRLTQHDVEHCIGEGQCTGVTLSPLDLAGCAAGHREHRLVQIDADDCSYAGQALRRHSGNDTGAARDVEDSITWVHGGGIHQNGCPLAEQGRNESRLVRLGRSQ